MNKHPKQIAAEATRAESKRTGQSAGSRAAACYAALSKRQMVLAKKHGTPAQFASACYDAVPGYISMDEAAAAIDKYNREWAEAA
jgi:hypothetical protein